MIKREDDRQRSVVEEASWLHLAAKFWSQHRPLKPNPEQVQADVIAYTSVRGPYIGRRHDRPFKGAKWERARPGREASIAQKMEGMPARIETYRKNLQSERHVARMKYPI